jgi:DNA-binding transcriptional LysR family regulator
VVCRHLRGAGLPVIDSSTTGSEGVEANSTRTLLALVDAGVGAAIVPSWVADRGDLRWRRIAELISPMTVSLYTVAGVPRSESVNAIIQLVERVVLERVQLADWRGAMAYVP